MEKRGEADFARPAESQRGDLLGEDGGRPTKVQAPARAGAWGPGLTPRGDPWHKLFVSGYGAGRSVSGTGDVSTYSPINAVYNMFNYTEGLQNPELVMRRLADRSSSGPVDRKQIFDVLCKATRTTNVNLTSEGIRVDGPWGEGMPLRGHHRAR